MVIDPLTLILLSSTVITLAVVLLFMAFSYTRNAQKLNHTLEVTSQLQQQLAQKPTRLLEKAHEQAKGKLSELERQQEALFTKASEEMKTAYQDMLLQIQEEDITTLKTMTKDIQSDILSDFKEFRDNLEKDTINSEKVVKEKIDEEYLEIEKELQEYKQKKYQKIDEDIYKILYRVSEMVLSQGITFDKHKQLVLEALDTAKKEQVFK